VKVYAVNCKLRGHGRVRAKVGHRFDGAALTGAMLILIAIYATIALDTRS
jgi:hypothetical protein